MLARAFGVAPAHGAGSDRLERYRQGARRLGTVRGERLRRRPGERQMERGGRALPEGLGRIVRGWGFGREVSFAAVHWQRTYRSRDLLRPHAHRPIRGPLLLG